MDVQLTFLDPDTSPPKVKSEKESPVPKLAASWNQQTVQANRSISASYQPSSSSGKVQVVIPVAPTPPKYSQPKKPKLNIKGYDTMTAVCLKDQKAEADDALLKLQDLLHEVFEAEDQIEPDTSVAPTPERPNPLFLNARSVDVYGAVLSTDAHNRIQKAIRKVTGFDRLQDIPSDYLNRIRKLCEKPIVVAAQAPDFSLNDPSSETEAHEWGGKLEDMLNALLAIGTLLQTMSGRQTERGLCPEDLI
jgi:cohesin loading factor subunit SCC2